MKMHQELVTSLVTKWHEMPRNATNSKSHQALVTSLVTNNGLFTRKIRFVTATTPPLEFVTNMRMYQELVTTLVTNCPEYSRHCQPLPDPRFLVEPLRKQVAGRRRQQSLAVMIIDELIK